MVKKYTKRRKAYRKIKKRVYKRRNKTNIVNIPRFPPENMRTILKYSEERLVTGSGGINTFAQLNYRTASLYAPYYSSTGATVYQVSERVSGQPGWFDDFSGWYRAYVVDKTIVNITVENDEPVDALVTAVICNSEAEGPVSTAGDWTTFRCPSRQVRVTSETEDKSIAKMKFIVDNYKTCGAGLADKKLSQANPLIATTSASPTLGPLLQIKISNAASSGTLGVKVRVRFTYYCRFIDVHPEIGADA